MLCEQEAAHRALTNLGSGHLESQGKQLRLVPGMRVNAEIYLGTRGVLGKPGRGSGLAFCFRNGDPRQKARPDPVSGAGAVAPNISMTRSPFPGGAGASGRHARSGGREKGTQPFFCEVLRRHVERGLPCGAEGFIRKLERQTKQLLHLRPRGRPKGA